MKLRVCGEYYPNINRSEWCVIANNENILSTFARWDTAISYACWLVKQPPFRQTTKELWQNRLK